MGLLLGGLGIILGVWSDPASLGIAVILVITAFGIHHFWTDDPEARMTEQVQFQKDISLAGAALILFAIYADPERDLTRLMLTDPLF